MAYRKEEIIIIRQFVTDDKCERLEINEVSLTAILMKMVILYFIGCLLLCDSEGKSLLCLFKSCYER